MDTGKVSTSQLDDFVIKCDELGGIASADCAEFIKSFSLVFDTKIDESLDPFLEPYVQQQISLYEEISARQLNQNTGELTPFGLEERINTANPYGTVDINFIAKHARCVQSAVLAAKLPPAAKVLDMGSGWGLSSEVIAFCGADLTSVDINPDFVTLVNRRAKRLGLPIQSIQSTFDEFTTTDKFDMIFFYECLHHAVRPWKVLKRVEGFLKAGGKVVFAGEPINDMWKHWGIRTDALSVYCIRKFGWFESGWTLAFLNSAFEHADLRLTIGHGVGLDGGVIGIAVRQAEKDSNNLAALSANATIDTFKPIERKPSREKSGSASGIISKLLSSWNSSHK